MLTLISAIVAVHCFLFYESFYYFQILRYIC